MHSEKKAAWLFTKTAQAEDTLFGGETEHFLNKLIIIIFILQHDRVG